MGTFLKISELIILGVVFLTCMVLIFVDDTVICLDEAGKVIMFMLGITAGAFLIDTVRLNWLKAREELKQTRKHGND